MGMIVSRFKHPEKASSIINTTEVDKVRLTNAALPTYIRKPKKNFNYKNTTTPHIYPNPLYLKTPLFQCM